MYGKRTFTAADDNKTTLRELTADFKEMKEELTQLTDAVGASNPATNQRALAANQEALAVNQQVLLAVLADKKEVAHLIAYAAERDGLEMKRYIWLALN